MYLLLVGLPIGFLISFLLICQLWKRNESEKFKEVLERYGGLKPLPIVGNLLDFFTANRLNVMMMYFKKCGDLFSFWSGSDLMIIFAEHKAMEALLSSTKNIVKSRDYKFMERWLGQGLLTSGPERWRKVRKILTPAFHFQILEKFVTKFQGPTEVLIRKMRQNVGNKSYDVCPAIVLNTLDIICETSMGTKVNAQENENSEYVEAVRKISEIIISRSVSLFWRFDFLYKLSGTYREESAALKILHDYTERVIKQRKKELLENKDEQILGEGRSKKISFLDVLLLSSMNGEHLTDLEIREEVDTFMFEGHDTTASGISFTLFCLANHPEVQSKVLQEQKEIFGDDQNPSVTMHHLNKMDYLNLVIKESLRLYPPVPIIGRHTTDDMQIDGTFFPKGAMYYAFLYGIQRNPKYFKNPNEFNPSRFSDSNLESPYCFVPFSAGPRNCIGQKFAMYEMKYVISSVMRNFELTIASPYEKPELEIEIILKSKNGLKVGLYERIY